MALLAAHEIAELEVERQRLMAVIAKVKPRRSTIIEAALKRVTRQMLELRVATGRTSR
jgi:hypothetical protein